MFERHIRRLRGDLGAMQPGWLRRLSGAQRKALACTLISLVAWSLWNGLREFDHPWGDLSRGQFTDHFSHMNAARVFPRIGRDIWRHPIADQFRQLDSEEVARTPHDIRIGVGMAPAFYVPGWPEAKPLITSWSSKPRMYPPGDMLLVAPIALLYHYTSLSLSGACRLLFGLFLITAHLALYFFFLTYFENQSSAIDWLACFFVYSQVLYWTLEGFYDPVAMVPLVLCARYLARNKGLAAVVAYCAGAMLHFRVFFQAPWALWGAWLMIQGKFWQHLRRRQVIALAVAALCAGVSLYVFWIDWAVLAHLASNNPIRHALSVENKAMTWNYQMVLLVCAVALLVSRAWFDLATLGWLALITLNLREFYYWHLLISMSWLAVPSKRQVVRGVRLAFLATTVALVFGNSLAPTWLRMLY